ncbi:hypothetical protein MP228_008700 [Amoeboaphelidium protococcarum]|nr:hypothetical protein MP228_008700 [Amoeboaphelidium protococcarum]
MKENVFISNKVQMQAGDSLKSGKRNIISSDDEDDELSAPVAFLQGAQQEKEDGQTGQELEFDFSRSRTVDQVLSEVPSFIQQRSSSESRRRSSTRVNPHSLPQQTSLQNLKRSKPGDGDDATETSADLSFLNSLVQQKEKRSRIGYEKLKSAVQIGNTANRKRLNEISQCTSDAVPTLTHDVVKESIVSVGQIDAKRIYAFSSYSLPEWNAEYLIGLMNSSSTQGEVADALRWSISNDQLDIFFASDFLSSQLKSGYYCPDTSACKVIVYLAVFHSSAAVRFGALQCMNILSEYGLMQLDVQYLLECFTLMGFIGSLDDKNNCIKIDADIDQVELPQRQLLPLEWKLHIKALLSITLIACKSNAVDSHLVKSLITLLSGEEYLWECDLEIMNLFQQLCTITGGCDMNHLSTKRSNISPLVAFTRLNEYKFSSGSEFDYVKLLRELKSCWQNLDLTQQGASVSKLIDRIKYMNSRINDCKGTDVVKSDCKQILQRFECLLRNWTIMYPSLTSNGGQQKNLDNFFSAIKQ